MLKRNTKMSLCCLVRSRRRIQSQGPIYTLAQSLTMLLIRWAHWPSKVRRGQPLTNLTWCSLQTHHIFLVFLRFSFINFTWSILECFVTFLYTLNTLNTFFENNDFWSICPKTPIFYFCCKKAGSSNMVLSKKKPFIKISVLVEVD